MERQTVSIAHRSVDLRNSLEYSFDHKIVHRCLNIDIITGSDTRICKNIRIEKNSHLLIFCIDCRSLSNVRQLICHIRKNCDTDKSIVTAIEEILGTYSVRRSDSCIDPTSVSRNQKLRIKPLEYFSGYLSVFIFIEESGATASKLDTTILRNVCSIAIDIITILCLVIVITRNLFVLLRE